MKTRGRKKCFFFCFQHLTFPRNLIYITMYYIMYYMEKNLVNEVKYKKIASKLKSDIESGVHVGKLPPVRALKKNYGVSIRTMNKALKILSGKRLIVSKGPKGTFIRKKTGGRLESGIVTIFYNSDAPGVLQSPLLKKLSKLIESDGCTPLFMHAPDANMFHNDDFWHSSSIDGYIFVFSSLNKELAANLFGKNVPFVVANRLPLEVDAHWVDFNLAKTFERLMPELQRLGRRKILLAVSRITLTSYVEHIKTIWETALSAEGVECEGRFVYFSEFDDEANVKLCLSEFEKAEADALFLLGIPPLDVEEKLAEKGKQLNVDYSLFYRANRTLAPIDRFPYFLASYDKLAQEVWTLFKSIINDPHQAARNVLVDDEFHLQGGFNH